MNKKFKYIFSVAAAAMMLGLSSCTGDLDVKPIDPNMNTEVQPNALFNKCFANLAMSGNSQGDGDCDIDGLDGGTSGFIRQLWNSNELTTDEAICHWTDDGMQEFDYNSYGSGQPMLNGFFARLTTGITYCNQYINSCGDVDATKTAEIRYLRALEYYFLMDAFGNIPFSTNITDEPSYMTRKEAYAWIEKELLEVEPLLPDPSVKHSTDKGYLTADKAAVWILLSRLYLNAEVYTGKPEWQKAKDYAKKVIDSPYKLNTTGVNGYSAYQMLFMGDNGESNAAQEGIFRIGQDGKTTTTWAGTLFLIASTWDATMGDKGTSQTWSGNRCRKDLILKFFKDGDAPNVNSAEMVQKAGDDRAIFDGVGRTLDNGLGYKGKFTDGFACAKWTNVKSDGSATHDANFVDGDFFLFRVAEAYLTYAEADARLNGNSTDAEGTKYVNALRARAHAEQKAGYKLNDLCDEWSREFYFEGLRRPTLIRFNRFGGNNNYNWSYKGGVKEGRNFDKTRNIFAIPANYVKGSLVQNPGY